MNALFDAEARRGPGDGAADAKNALLAWNAMIPDA